MNDIELYINSYRPPYQEQVHIDMKKNEITITGNIPDDPEYISKMNAKIIRGIKDVYDVYLVRNGILLVFSYSSMEINITMEMYALSQKYSIKLKV